MAISDSVDPDQLLSDLRQLATLAQRLGIDLSKVAVMGQSIGGKGTTGNSPLETQNPDHAAHHSGGGTGYDNLAMGAIAGMKSAKAPSVYNSFNVSPQQEAQAAKFQSLRDKKSSFMSGSALDVAAAQGREIKAFQKSIGYKRPKSFLQGLGSRSERRMIGTFFSLAAIQGVSEEAFQFFSEPLALSRGETYQMRLMGNAIGVANTGARIVQGLAAYKFVKNAQDAYRVASLAKVALKSGMLKTGARTAIRAIGMSGPQATIYLGLEAAMAVGSEVFSRYKETEGFKVSQARIHRGWMGEMHRGFDYIAGYRYPKIPRPLSETAIQAMNDQAYEDRKTWYIDDYGRKRKRNAIQRALFKQQDEMGWLTNPVLRLWNGMGGADDVEKLKDAKNKRANQQSQAALKKLEILDLKSAKYLLKEAMEAYPGKAADTAPFFWREPEKFLMGMESARIAGRNWARSQQPRGGLRSGD